MQTELVAAVARLMRSSGRARAIAGWADKPRKPAPKTPRCRMIRNEFLNFG
ncbi:MAG: hypothetical protein ACYTXT_43205 [Nostoc sp.]